MVNPSGPTRGSVQSRTPAGTSPASAITAQSEGRTPMTTLTPPVVDSSCTTPTAAVRASSAASGAETSNSR